MKTLKQYCSAGLEHVWKLCKKIWEILLHSNYRYIAKALLQLGVIIYLCYLLSDFTTIPVRDYYFDIYSASYDSIIPDIRVVVGNTNVLNTYSDAAATTIGVIMDSVYRKSQKDERYAPFVSTYKHDKDLQFSEKNLDTLSSFYIYVQAYLHRYSSMPVGYRSPDMVRDYYDSTKFYSIQSLKLYGANEVFPTSQGKNYITDTLLCNKLSPNHSYYSTNSLIVKSPGCRDGMAGINMKSSNRMTRSDKLGRLFPRMNLFLSRENIALQEYRFCIHPHDIDAYSITLQTRGGAIIQNNPSDELQVLNLHDTRIIKRRTISIPKYTLVDELPTMDEKYYNSDIFVSIPENDGLQYIRLFFVTMVIGLLLESCCKDVIRFFRERPRN